MRFNYSAISFLTVSFPLMKSAAQKAANTAILIITTLAPVGEEYSYDNINPLRKQKTDMTAEQITTFRKHLKKRMEDIAGKIIRLDMSRAPIILMPSTMVMAVSTAMSIL